MNTEIYPEWKQAATDIVRNFDYGDTVQFSWLYDALRLKKPKQGTEKEFRDFQFRFLSNIESIKTELLDEHQMYLHSIRGDGYLIVKPDEQSNIAWRKMKKQLWKTLRHTHRALINVNHGLISSDERKNNNNKLACLSHIEVMAKRSVKDGNLQIV